MVALSSGRCTVTLENDCDWLRWGTHSERATDILDESLGEEGTG
jgi:hypothetical protein